MSVGFRSAILAEVHAYSRIYGINGLDISPDVNVTWVCHGGNREINKIRNASTIIERLSDKVFPGKEVTVGH